MERSEHCSFVSPKTIHTIGILLVAGICGATGYEIGKVMEKGEMSAKEERRDEKPLSLDEVETHIGNLEKWITQLENADDPRSKDMTDSQKAAEVCSVLESVGRNELRLELLVPSISKDPHMQARYVLALSELDEIGKRARTFYGSVYARTRSQEKAVPHK